MHTAESVMLVTIMMMMMMMMTAATLIMIENADGDDLQGDLVLCC